ncbi:MAG: hypothetical protein WBC06_16820 [Chitinophagaceae bacterium]
MMNNYFLQRLWRAGNAVVMGNKDSRIETNACRNKVNAFELSQL